MTLNKCPDAFWDFGIQYVLRLRQLLVRSAASGRAPIETNTGETPDMSEFMNFDFYQWIKYCEQTDKDNPITLTHTQIKQMKHLMEINTVITLLQNAEVYREQYEIAKVIGRKRNADRNYIGRAHKNPQLDSRIFTVCFPNGEEKDITYNILAEHLFSQVDSEGNQYCLFREIIHHRRRKSALDKADQYRIPNNRKG